METVRVERAHQGKPHLRGCWRSRRWPRSSTPAVVGRTPATCGWSAEMAYYLALAQLWNLLAGYAGLVSVGQQAYVGLGGYVLFYMTGALNMNVYLALAIAGPFAGLMSIPVSFAVFRLRGAYFAVGTWVVSEVFALAREPDRACSAPARACRSRPRSCGRSRPTAPAAT